MATVISSKFPVDTLPDVAVGVSLPFTGKSIFNQTYITRDQIRTNLINFFLTNKGERYFNPSFGTGLKSLIFEMISLNTLDNLESIIQEELSLYFPTVKIKNLEINSLPNENAISMFLTYRVLNQSLDEIKINFNTDGI